MVRGDKIYNDAFDHENESESGWVRFMTSVRKCRPAHIVAHWSRKADDSFSKLHPEGRSILSLHHLPMSLPNSPVGPSIGRPMLLTTDHVGQRKELGYHSRTGSHFWPF